MTEPTIICPNCKTEIKLTESLAAPLIESTRQQFEQQLAQKDSDIAQREQAIREKAKKQLRVKEAITLCQEMDLVSPWVEVDTEKMEGVFKAYPDRVELSADINESLIVELYSK